MSPPPPDCNQVGGGLDAGASQALDCVLDGIATAADKIGDAFIRISYTQRALKAALSGNFSQIAKLIFGNKTLIND